MTEPELRLREPQVLVMAEKFRYEAEHCRRVANLAQALFEHLKPLHGLGDVEARLLRHAALLHDIGHFVHYRRHHRHSAYLIRHDATLAGYPEEERKLVALISRNHRKKPTLPDPELAPRLNRVALPLAAILRLADGLDHDRTGEVAIGECEIGRHTIRLSLSGVDPVGDATVLATKAALIKPAFGRKLIWQSSRPAATAAAAAPVEPAGA